MTTTLPGTLTLCAAGLQCKVRIPSGRTPAALIAHHAERTP